VQPDSVSVTEEDIHQSPHASNASIRQWPLVHWVRRYVVVDVDLHSVIALKSQVGQITVAPICVQLPPFADHRSSIGNVRASVFMSSTESLNSHGGFLTRRHYGLLLDNL
jgi:hypothetical protein